MLLDLHLLHGKINRLLLPGETEKAKKEGLLVGLLSGESKRRLSC